MNLFHEQLTKNKVYRQFVQTLGINTEKITQPWQVPFLPVEFFKTHDIKTFEGEPEAIFTSSGTTGSTTSRHQIFSLALYEEVFIKAFHLFYGDPKDYCILGLLPSYLERKESSLVYMVQKLMEISAHPHQGFYLHNYKDLAQKLSSSVLKNQKVLLIGVTYALLDFAEEFKQALPNVTVMETGGMKGRRKEMIRPQVHEILKNAWSLKEIHSEYGMTELLSQAYSKGEGVFYTPPWMRVFIREINDPFSLVPQGKSGLVNVIDLANKYSCPFIATQDIGKQFPDGGFEILGRADNSDVRGCNLLAL